MTDISLLAQKAAIQLGWNAEFIEKQWTLETGHFTSHAWLIDNNPAGIKWYQKMTFGTKGIQAGDGGFYAHFTDPVNGYVQFIKHNPRYSHVGDSQDPYEEAKSIALAGWATDPHYADKIMSISVSSTPTTKNTLGWWPYLPSKGKFVTPSGGWNPDSVVDLLQSHGYTADFNSRSILANAMGIHGYKGTAEQNLSMVHALHAAGIY